MRITCGVEFIGDCPSFQTTPFSLGIENVDGKVVKVVEKNSLIPFKKAKKFSTNSVTEGKINVEIHVLQGERELARDNRTLGRFQLTDIRASSGQNIEVTFDTNSDGILSVSAKDAKTNKEASIKIESSLALSDQQIIKMMKRIDNPREMEDQKEIEEERKDEGGFWHFLFGK